jgi:hypothetical protein
MTTEETQASMNYNHAAARLKTSFNMKWTNHVGRLTEDRRCVPGLALRYHPSGRRVLGRPKQRWQEQQHLKDKKEKA